MQSFRFTLTPGRRLTRRRAAIKLSNPAVLPTVCHLAALQVFDEAGFAPLRVKSVLLTGYLELLLCDLTDRNTVRIITPRNPNEVSLCYHHVVSFAT